MSPCLLGAQFAMPAGGRVVFFFTLVILTTKFYYASLKDLRRRWWYLQRQKEQRPERFWGIHTQRKEIEREAEREVFMESLSPSPPRPTIAGSPFLHVMRPPGVNERRTRAHRSNCTLDTCIGTIRRHQFATDENHPPLGDIAVCEFDRMPFPPPLPRTSSARRSIQAQRGRET